MDNMTIDNNIICMCVLVCCFTLVNLQRDMENMAIKNLYLDHKVQLMCYYSFWNRHHELIRQ